MKLWTVAVVVGLLTLEARADKIPKYVYKYETNSSEYSGGEYASHFASLLETHVVWKGSSEEEGSIVAFQLKDVTTLTSVKMDAPYLGQYKNGKISSLYFAETDVQDYHLLNVKRGIASLFQFKTKEWEGWEMDVSGNCYVTYAVEPNSKIRKNKWDCVSDGETATQRKDEILDLKYEWTSEAIFDVRHDGILRSAITNESLIEKMLILKKIGLSVTSSQEIKLIDEDSTDKVIDSSAKEVTDVLAKIGKMFSCVFVEVDFNSKLHIAQKSEITPNTLSAIRGKLKTRVLATKKGAKGYTEAFEKLRFADEKSLVKVLKHKNNQDILPQLMDVMGSIHTIASFKAVFASFNPESINIHLLERFLWALSSMEMYRGFSKDNELMANELLKHLKESKFSNPKLKKTFMGTLVLMCNNIRDSTDIEQWLIMSLRNCKYEEDCLEDFLRSFRNYDFNLDEKFSNVLIEDLFSYCKAEAVSKKVKILALKVLKSIPSLLDINEENSKILLTIFMSPYEDTSVRILCMEILLRRPKHFLIETVINSVKTSSDREFNAYVVNYIIDRASVDEILKFIIGDFVMIGDWSWNLLSQGGLSNSFSGEALRNGSTIANYGFNLEIANKLLKRSSLSLGLTSSEYLATSPFLQLDIFAGGLSSFLGEETDSNDQQSANAGMELALLGVPLRPFIFFSSMGELTGLYWSGALEKKTSALQGSRFLHFYTKNNRFTSGLIVETSVKSAVSYDFSGSAVVSLFSQTADGSVETSFGGVFSFSSDFVWLENDLKRSYDAEGEVKLDFTADIHFDGNTCVKLILAPSSFDQSYNISKGKSSSSPTKISRKTPGKTFFLDRKISELCNNLYQTS